MKYTRSDALVIATTPTSTLELEEKNGAGTEQRYAITDHQRADEAARKAKSSSSEPLGDRIVAGPKGKGGEPMLTRLLGRRRKIADTPERFTPTDPDMRRAYHEFARLGPTIEATLHQKGQSLQQFGYWSHQKNDDTTFMFSGGGYPLRHILIAVRFAQNDDRSYVVEVVDVDSYRIEQVPISEFTGERLSRALDSVLDGRSRELEEARRYRLEKAAGESGRISDGQAAWLVQEERRRQEQRRKRR